MSGRVQGVFYRDSARREAERLRITGWARNLDDGRVEVVAEGEEAAVDRLVNWARQGPARARVEKVEIATEKATGLKGFAVR